jgi:hypothetical protein
MGPESAKSFPGRQLVSGEAPAALAHPERPTPPTAGSGVASPIGRATQESDDGRRGKGDLFGAFKPAAGEALTAPYAGRTTANYVDFLTRVAAWIPSDIERIYAIMDHLSAQRATEVLLCSLAHPRWEFVFQPK